MQVQYVQRYGLQWCGTLRELRHSRTLTTPVKDREIIFVSQMRAELLQGYPFHKRRPACSYHHGGDTSVLCFANRLVPNAKVWRCTEVPVEALMRASDNLGSIAQKVYFIKSGQTDDYHRRLPTYIRHPLPSTHQTALFPIHRIIRPSSVASKRPLSTLYITTTISLRYLPTVV